MTNEKTIDFKVGDEIWWFQAKERIVMYQLSRILPDSIELVHDTITAIEDGNLVGFHGTYYPKNIWGKSRKEAWDRMKESIEKWGVLG